MPFTFGLPGALTSREKIGSVLRRGTLFSHPFCGTRCPSPCGDSFLPEGRRFRKVTGFVGALVTWRNGFAAMRTGISVNPLKKKTFIPENPSVREISQPPMFGKSGFVLRKGQTSENDDSFIDIVPEYGVRNLNPR
ncbi:hypothetical protein CEXT_681231 [Caerostris extrusa]|uniref:Uncharacterized protein n=1 Tax=Caerostris extrusa TaxID=172846 RepID=A0AAV4RB94_CAEEX|nr:hypothetical protein CEXT_681231 [Caerostris extrusa]